MAPAHERIEVARALVDDAHGHVAKGRYPDAVACFRRALQSYRAELGDEHPDTVELRLDLDTVLQMDGVAAFAKEHGIRWQDQGLPLPPDAEG